MCDLDSFKEINDRYGHEFGDAALRHVANILRESVGGDNTVLSRVGGEEFALLLTDIPKAGCARVRRKRFELNVAAHPVEWRGATRRRSP